MTTLELRDLVIEQRAEYNNKVQAAERGCKLMQEAVNSITPQIEEKLVEAGFDSSVLKDIDYEALKNDKEYNEAKRAEIRKFLDSLRSYVESQISGW